MLIGKNEYKLLFIDCCIELFPLKEVCVLGDAHDDKMTPLNLTG